MARGDQAVRVIRILLAFFDKKNSGLTVEELTSTFKVSRRTIYRDLECLLSAGVSLDSQKTEQRARWRLIENATNSERAYTASIATLIPEDSAALGINGSAGDSRGGSQAVS